MSSPSVGIPGPVRHSVRAALRQARLGLQQAAARLATWAAPSAAPFPSLEWALLALRCAAWGAE